MKVASALLSEIYGSSSGELLETPVEGCQVREDYLSPDEYLRQEQGIYKEHRREAMIATRAWQKAVNRYGPHVFGQVRLVVGRYRPCKLVVPGEDG